MRLAEIETVRGTHAPGYLYIKEIGVFVHEMLLPVIKEILAELDTETYKDRPHGRCSTNNAGCNGPLCLYARRKWWSGYYTRKQAQRGKIHKPRYNATHELTDLVLQLFTDRENARWEQKKLTAELEKVLDQSEQNTWRPAKPGETPGQLTPQLEPAPLMPVLLGSLA